MAILKINEKHTATAAITASVMFLCACVIFFLPVEIPHMITICTSILTIASLWLCPWQITMALLFSTLGDHMGSCGNFLGQMGFFALAHIAYIVFFCRTCPQGRASDGMKWKSAIVALYGVVVGMLIVPHVHRFLQVGVSVYVLLILTMCILSWRQKNPYYALGAWLFVLSDTVLAWNKFVFHIEGASYLIMIPYYLGQWMLFIQSFKSAQNA